MVNSFCRSCSPGIRKTFLQDPFCRKGAAVHNNSNNMKSIQVCCLPLLLSGLRFVFSGTGLVDPVVPDAELKIALVGKYSLYRKKVTWAEAQIFCEKHEGILATFTDSSDARTVIDKIYSMSHKPTQGYLIGVEKSEFGLDRRYWIGMSDLMTGEGNFVWAEKGVKLAYKDLWYPGQPDHIDKNNQYLGRPQHYVSFWNPVFHKDRKHSFDDIECAEKYYFICEHVPDKLTAQKEYQKINPNYKFARGLGKLRLHGRRVKKVLQKGRMAQSVDSNSRTVSKKTGKLADKLKTEPGFSQLFESSESLELNQIQRKKNALIPEFLKMVDGA